MKRSTLTAIAALIAVALPTAGSATTMQQLDLSELTWVADLVAEAVVEGNDVERVEGRDWIRTVTTMRLTRVLKGDHAEGDRIDVLALGGSIGDEETSLPSSPVFAPDERVLVFLEQRDGEWHSVGLSQGKFTMIEEVDTGLDVLVKLGLPRGLTRFDESLVTLPARRWYAEDLVARVQGDLAADFVPTYRRIAGLPDHKEAAFKAAAIAAGKYDARWDGDDR